MPWTAPDLRRMAADAGASYRATVHYDPDADRMVARVIVERVTGGMRAAGIVAAVEGGAAYALAARFVHGEAIARGLLPPMPATPLP